MSNMGPPTPANKFVPTTTIPANIPTGVFVTSKAKLDAIVCSPQEVKLVKKIFKKEIITPGIRLAGDSKGDQRRVMTPKQAFQNGATSLVMGRSLIKGKIEQNIKKLIKELS